jgi:ATP-dependent DNA helicase RecG
MTRDELIERLKGYEWDDVEFKRARHAVPEDAYRTVSAFANTAGGWLIFGVKQEKGQFVISGVEDVDKIQNDFLSCLRAGDKLSRAIDARGKLYDFEGKTVLAFFIPGLPRSEKPVYLKGDPRQSYTRRGGGDERSTPKELERFLRDAAKVPFDSETIEELDIKTFFDEKSLSWYRRKFNEREPGRHEILDDQEFLREWNFIAEASGRLAVTLCALLLFGKGRYVRRWLHRPVVDFQIIHERYNDWNPDHRWDDRIVVEDNIVQAWLAIVERYLKHADRPFEIDAASLRRHDEPPDYISFREAAINLLIHQDYGDTGRHAQIQIFRDRTRFWNPGDAFGTIDQLLEPGAKDLRNPNLVGAFRRIGLSDQAGTGIRAIFRNWRQLGYMPPQLVNQRAEKAFELTLLKEPIVSENQKMFQKELGVHLNDLEADVFSFACKRDRITLTDARAIGGLNSADTLAMLDRLIAQKLLEPSERGSIYALAQPLRQRYMATLFDDKAESRQSQDRVTFRGDLTKLALRSTQ